MTSKFFQLPQVIAILSRDKDMFYKLYIGNYKIFKHFDVFFFNLIPFHIVLRITLFPLHTIFQLCHTHGISVRIHQLRTHIKNES